MSDELLVVICEDEHHHGLARLLDELARPSRMRRVVYLSAFGLGGMFPMAHRVLRDGVPNLGGQRPDGLALVIDADRGFEVQRNTLREFERRPREATALEVWHRSLQSQLQHLLRDQCQEVATREKLFAFALCWSLESVAIASPSRFARIAGALPEQGREVDQLLAECSPKDPRMVPPRDFASTFQRPADCFRRIYRAATDLRPSKGRVSDTVGAMASSLGDETDEIMARVPGLADLVAWLSSARETPTR